MAASNTGPRTAEEGKNLIFFFFFPPQSPPRPPAPHGGHSPKGKGSPQCLKMELVLALSPCRGQDKGPCAEPGCQPCPESNDTASGWLCPFAALPDVGWERGKQIPRCRQGLAEGWKCAGQMWGTGLCSGLSQGVAKAACSRAWWGCSSG